MSSDARTEILARIRRANAAVAPVVPGPVPRPEATRPDPAEVLETFVETVADYRAVVERCTPVQLPARVAAALGGARSVVRPGDLDRGWLSGFAGAVVVDDGLDAAALDRVDGVVTAAAVGIAATGTIVLDHGPGQGRRAITLVPDLHVCVVTASQVCPDVRTATARLEPSVRAGRPLTWISGPSATSDIELDRVEGVHGPRTLHVLLVDDA